MTRLLTRRFAFCGLFCACATPATAQISIDLNKLARTAKAATIGEKDELAMGAQLYGPSIDAMGGAYANRAVQAAVRRVAEPLLRTSARTAFGWEVTVIDANEVNAWALPGGKIGINKGLLRYVDNEDELAAVIAHEMGHAEFSHAIKEMRSKALTGMALDTAGQAATARADADSRQVVGLGLQGVNFAVLSLAASGYSRDNEREADRNIATVFGKTGHSVAVGAGFYRTLLEIVPPQTRGRTSLFAGHPQTRERIAELTAGTPAAPPQPRKGPAFTEIKQTFPTRKVYRRNGGA